MKILLTSQAVEEGAEAPRWYGFAWRDYLTETKIFYPMPFHLIFRWARDLYFWFMIVGRPGYRERWDREQSKRWRSKILAAYEKGYVRGYNEGMDRNVELAVRRVLKKEGD